MRAPADIMESTEARQLREAGTVVENELNERRNKMALGATLNGRSWIR